MLGNMYLLDVSSIMDQNGKSHTEVWLVVQDKYKVNGFSNNDNDKSTDSGTNP